MRRKRTAFVFAGGGSLGAIQVGILRELVRAGERPDFVVGSSVGAINACFFAGRPTEDGVEALTEIWRSLHRRDIFPLSAHYALRAGCAAAAACLTHPIYVAFWSAI